MHQESSEVTLMIDRLQQAGYQVSRDSKGNYYQGMLKLAGDLKALDFLRNETILRLFTNAQVRKGIAYTFGEIKAIALPRQQMEKFAHLVQELASRQIFIRGYVLHCPICDLELWYPLTDIHEQMRCQGCRSFFQLPLELDFSYRLNQLFAVGINQGALTVLLTALYLQRSSRSMVWDANYQLKKNGDKMELDFIAVCDGALVLAECKDNFKPDDIEPQLHHYLHLTEEVRADRFIFATLKTDLPPLLLEMLANRGEVLGRNDLLGTNAE
ncbi:MAG: hypothetical protein K8I82_03600 [Anaerolineae bacterium]|nr:hypothetical protein [Anaerolineae bacterium]